LPVMKTNCFINISRFIHHINTVCFSCRYVRNCSNISGIEPETSGIEATAGFGYLLYRSF
jgi:hypothetical protein